MENCIDVSEAKNEDLVRAAYDLSKPQGMGIIHYRSGGLTDDEVDIILSNQRNNIVASMDYINGRSCKFTIFKKDDKRYIRDRWYDHTEEDLAELLRRCGVTKR